MLKVCTRKFLYFLSSDLLLKCKIKQIVTENTKYCQIPLNFRNEKNVGIIDVIIRLIAIQQITKSTTEKFFFIFLVIK